MKKGVVLFFILGLGILFSCNGPKQLVNQGKKYEKERNYEEALNKYSEAHSKDPKNKDAIKGMKKAGGKILKERLDDFNNAYRLSNYSGAIDIYHDCEVMVENLEKKEVYLSIPDSTKENYKRSVSRQVNALYMEAAKNIDAGKYQKAKELANEIEKYDDTFDQLKSLRLSIEADPYYQKGLDAYNRGDKSTAITELTKVQEIYPDYRDTKKIIEELVSGSMVKIGYIPVDNQSKEPALGKEMNDMLTAEMNRMQNQLLKVYNGTSMSYAPAKNGAVPDDKMLINMGKAISLDKLLVASVVSYNVETSPGQQDWIVAYVKEKVITQDPYYGQMVNYQYREVKYKEVSEETKVTIVFKYRLMNVKDGNIIYNDVLTKSVINKVKYADYDGVLEDLYPNTGYINQNDLKKWRSRFTAKSEVKPVSEITTITEEEVMRQLVSDLQKYIYTQ